VGAATIVGEAVAVSSPEELGLKGFGFVETSSSGQRLRSEDLGFMVMLWGMMVEITVAN
jgi:hypothetical protein